MSFDGKNQRGRHEASQEERDLFLQEVSGAVRIERSSAGPVPERDRKPLLPDEEGEWRSFARRLMKSSFQDFDITLSTEYVEGKRKGVTTAMMERLRRGELAVEASLDLHGMDRKVARQRVRAFVLASLKRGHRCVLIVHGRGKRSREGIPVLKNNLVAWMEAASGIGRHILAFVTARPCDGGPGAVYVLLS